jgi:hypothetical protein
MKRPAMSLAIGSLLLFIATSPVIAQGKSDQGGSKGRGAKPHASDDDGPGKGNDIFGGNGAASAAVAASILAARSQVVGALNSSNIALPSASVGARERATAIAHVAKLFRGVPESMESVDQMSAAVSRSGVSPAQTREMLQSVALLGVVSGKDPGAVVEARARTAAADFNRFVNSASVEFLTNPPADFLVLRAAIVPFVRALDTSR